MKIQLAVAAVPLSIARGYVKGWDKNGIGVQAVRKTLPKGSKAYRVYVPIKPGKRPKVVVPKFIDRAISSAGYKVEDYITGIAVDLAGKRRMKIGKLLKDEELRNQFANDPQRSAFKNDYVCVISAHPYDVIGMSTGRRWDDTSCMRLNQPGKRGGAFQSTVRHDVAEGTLVAYVISPNDKNINKPHGRLLIKPFKDEHDNVLFRVETTVYGTPVPGFVETVQRWLKKINKGAAQGVYKIPENLYDDGVGETFINIDLSKLTDDEMVQHWEDYKPARRRLLLQSDIGWAKAAILYVLRAPNGTDDDKAYAIVTGISRSGVVLDAADTRKLAKIIDGFLPEELAKYVMLDLLSHGSEKVVKASAKLKAAADAYYAYDPERKMNVATAAIYASYEPRFLANISSINDRDNRDMGGIVRAFIRGHYKDTKEFRNTKMEGSLRLRRVLGVVAAALLKIPDSLKDNGENVAKMARWFPADEIYNFKTWKDIDVRGMTTINRSLNTEHGNLAVGLCALHNSWPRQLSGLVENTVGVEESPAAMENICDCRNTASQGFLLNKLIEKGLLKDTEWLREHRYVRNLLQTIADDKDGEWAETRIQKAAVSVLDKLAKSRQQMEDLFKEMKDAGFDDGDEEDDLFDDED